MTRGPFQNTVALCLGALLFASAALSVVPAHCLRAWLAPMSGDGMVEAHLPGPAGTHQDSHDMHDMPANHEHHAPVGEPLQAPSHPEPPACTDCATVVLSCCDSAQAPRAEAIVTSRDDELSTTRILVANRATSAWHGDDPPPLPRASARSLRAGFPTVSSPSQLGVFLI